MKRIFDITFSSICLIILSPLFIAIAFLIKLDSPGPVFFIERMMGRRFRPFYLIKFRTTVCGASSDASGNGPQVTPPDKLMLTRVGRFICRTKIYELPQLWNVLKGDMSIVGPRPVRETLANKSRKDFDEILKLRPGIIDIASFTYSDELIIKDKKSEEDYYVHILLPEKIRLAKDYMKNSSIIDDLGLILLALLKLFYPHIQHIVNSVINTIAPIRRHVVIGLQILTFIFSNYLAFLIRFDGHIPSLDYLLFLKYLPLLLLSRVIFLFIFSMDKGLWRYVSIKDLLNISSGITLSSLMFFITIVFLFGDVYYPRSIYVIDWLLNIFLLSGLRLLRRFNEIKIVVKNADKRVIIIGAGDSTEMLLRDIAQNLAYPFDVIGLVDDNPMKKGLKIRNIPILGTRKDLTSIVNRMNPDEFLIAIPSASALQLTEISQDLRKYGLPIKTIPNLWGILNGREALNQLKIIEPEDVLFRAPVSFSDIELKELISCKRVMITGAGGSIGSELSRQIASLGPEYLILFERHEESLFKINMELSSILTPANLFPVIGDVIDERRVSETMERFRPQVIFHAAAYKHVPLMEESPFEAYKTNVMGSNFLAEKAREFGAERFIMVSTDKAVNPVNVMGMTKKIAEKLVCHLSTENNGMPSYTKYMIVRFGNVLESSGSVVPIFKDQIKRGGPITVTHPDMTRYFMTIPESVSLVLQAAAMGNGGEVFVLDMGEPVKILDLAKKMISIYGYKPGIDIPITFTGLRPGEKLYEDLFNTNEIVRKTSHSRINMALSDRKINRDILRVIMSFYNKGLIMTKTDLIRICNELVENNREHKRYCLRFSFSFLLNSKELKLKDKIIDIGIGGFSTKLCQVMTSGEKVSVSVFLPENGNKISWSTHAEVVWSMREGDSYKYGFKFMDTNYEQKRKLEDFIKCKYEDNTDTSLLMTPKSLKGDVA